ncbi:MULTISPECIES: ankyrin repeat domain-containing protein [unclassified Rhodococcus (in: high G+C Gram-positive bacteria)]|uniref:ankyrin repeat domain-containing protein n=1 Tax=unclassified Rhodococcus (in: high G+C Gram-positive bacteria) TaxID=192944 RepID=UPI00211CD8FB|nr:MULTISPECIES: ankyrin repeat domain-containing protein [unclassified Rhodococcus (in: high G+C Gram-positive bacteria)]
MTAHIRIALDIHDATLPRLPLGFRPMINYPGRWTRYKEALVAKRRTLPKDFDEKLKTESLDDLKAVFDKSMLDARGGSSKQTAIGFVECPDELIIWLVEQGLDVDAADLYEDTPLWTRASRGRAEQIPLLLSLGADIQRPSRYGESPLHAAAGGQRPDATRVLLEHGADARALNGAGETPMLHGLRRTRNFVIPGMARVAKLLLDAGDPVTEEMRAAATRIGTEFEFHRDSFNPDFLDETDAGLTELYRLFGVTPVAGRRRHDGVSPIAVPTGAWQDQHQALWELLVPSNGPATTVQGEVVRLTGRIAREILDDGSPNWGRDFRHMLAALPEHYASGTPLPAGELQEAQSLSRALKSGDGDDAQVYRLSELAVAWVASNPTPVPLGKVNYGR